MIMTIENYHDGDVDKTHENHGIDRNDNAGDVMMVLDCNEKNNQEDNDIKNQNGDIVDDNKNDNVIRRVLDCDEKDN